MIYTRYGSEVEIVGQDDIFLKVRRKTDGEMFMATASELKADGGAKEILDAVRKHRGE